MQTVKNRRGLALGAVFALVASAFVSVPASATDQSTAVVFPAVDDTKFTMLMTEEFGLQLNYGSSVADRFSTFTNTAAAGLGLVITKPTGVTLSAALTGSATARNVYDTQLSSSDAIQIGTVAATSVELGIAGSASPRVVNLTLPGRTSVSAAVSLTVTPFLDLNNDGDRDAGEPLGTARTVTFAPWSALGASLVLSQPVAGDRGATASLTITAGDFNFEQMNSGFVIAFGSTNDQKTLAYAGAGNNSQSATVPAQTMENSYNYSFSANAPTAPFSGSPVASVSARAFYDGVALTSTSTLGVTPDVTTGLTFSAVAGSNLRVTAPGTGDVRINSSFALDVYGHGASPTFSPVTSLRTTVSIAVGGAESLSTTKTLTVNGVTYTSSVPAIGFTGRGTLNVTAAGFETDGTTITFTASSGLETPVTYVATLKNATWTLTTSDTVFNVAGQPGASATWNLRVQDQWQVISNRVNQRVIGTVNLGSSVSDTVSVAVVNGLASITLTPTPATRTGSATVTLQAQAQNADTGVWANIGSALSPTLIVSSLADGFDSRTASVSASISRVVSAATVYSWSGVVTVNVVNTYSNVLVSAQGLVIRSGAVTASNTMTVRSDASANAAFEFAGTVAGTYTVTFTNGSATTTSQVIISPAVNNEGTTISMTVAPATASQSKTITYTGRVLDGYGNPVDTTRTFNGGATASIEVTFTGPAQASGTFPTETNADGEFTFNLQTAANDEGTIVVTVRYLSAGAATATADVVTATARTSVVAPVPAVAQTVSVVVGRSVVAGNNLDVTITVTNDAGNAHAYKSVVVYSTGAGYLNASTVTTDGDGKAVVKLITTANDRGTATVFASIDGKSGSAATTVTAPAAAPTAQTVSVTVGTSVVAGNNLTATIVVTDTAGAAYANKTVSVYSTGAGYLNSTTAVTDANGRAQVVLVTRVGESGAATVFATIDGKTGSAATTVTAPAAPEVNAIIGTFNGRWAVRVENAKGAQVSVKVGNTWFRYTSLNDNYLYTRASRVGATLAVSVWVNGELQNSQTITIR